MTATRDNGAADMMICDELGGVRQAMVRLLMQRIRESVDACERRAFAVICARRG